MTIFEKVNPERKIIRLRYNSLGENYYIQIIGTSTFIHYSPIYIQPGQRTVDAYLYTNPIIKSNLATNKYKIKNNKFLSFMAQVFNGQYANPNVSRNAAVLFYHVSPKSPKAQRQEYMRTLNPDDTLEGVFEQLGGTLFLYKGHGLYNYKGEPVIAFVWFHSNFESIMELGKTIELDCLFKALSPDVYCIPQIIYKNTGFPVGIIVGPKESSDLYSLFFESLKKMDEEGQIYEIFRKKEYLTDQHSAFKKLYKEYNISILHCIVDIIRNCGAKSALSLIVRELLFCFSEETFNKNIVKWKTQFNELTRDTHSSALSWNSKINLIF